MNYALSSSSQEIHQKIILPGSKSESNRLLILQSFLPEISLENLSDSDDTEVLKQSLSCKQRIIDVGHAGTAMRFLTAYFSIQQQKQFLLTGSKRMQERPIGILVEALKKLGAKIEYDKNEGYPPLKISGKEIVQSEVNLQANVSSQYISALLLIAPFLANGLQLILEQKITSAPYVEMTVNLLKELGAKIDFQLDKISVKPLKSIPKKINFQIESDWSAASYFYSFLALSKKGSIQLSYLKRKSLQGDSCLVHLYKSFGVKTSFLSNQRILLEKIQNFNQPTFYEKDLSASPDLAQTIVVTCLGLSIGCKITGLHTLKIKETDRLQALKNELEKFGAQIRLTETSLLMQPPKNLNQDVKVQTYQDHRMAMSFAPLVLRTPLVIQDAEVVSKSFPQFWNAIKRLQIEVKKSI
ncbi:3-phosphoshikimate 1-carboxyvinyltransferase [Mesonia aquimarina]|uniref:3-phosphoshikimate 1-carboxyvinyltransferase n=1 Tax=Mesonia aquimarina TaxID=1504967 RepID=UPI000EF63055|nr:3-phosphoshikimate 1-carboxyvinyltransferase [Mesonia aquimarina]